MEIDIKNLSPLFLIQTYAGIIVFFQGWRSTTRRRFDNRDNETRSSNEGSFLHEWRKKEKRSRIVALDEQ